jgi:hypothetical protein
MRENTAGGLHFAQIIVSRAMCLEQILKEEDDYSSVNVTSTPRSMTLYLAALALAAFFSRVNSWIFSLKYLRKGNPVTSFDTARPTDSPIEGVQCR